MRFVFFKQHQQETQVKGCCRCCLHTCVSESTGLVCHSLCRLIAWRPHPFEPGQRGRAKFRHSITRNNVVPSCQVCRIWHAATGIVSICSGRIHSPCSHASWTPTASPITIIQFIFIIGFYFAISIIIVELLIRPCILRKNVPRSGTARQAPCTPVHSCWRNNLSSIPTVARCAQNERSYATVGFNRK